MSSERRRFRWRNGYALIGYLVLTVGMTWPMVTRLNSHLIGNNIDVWINTWVTWWTKRALTQGLNLFHTDMMFYGRGASLVFHSFSHFNTALELLLQPLMGILPAYNIVILLTRVLSGYGMYCLVHYLTRRPVVAFFSGFVFAFCPYLMYECSHPVLVSTQWMPFFMLHLIRLVREQRRRSILPAAAFFVLTALCSWHLMIFLALLAALYLLVSFFTERSSWSLSTWRDLALLGLVAFVVLSPFFYLFVKEQVTVDNPYMNASGGIGTDIAAFFLPAAGNPMLNVVSKDPVADRPFYVGFLVISLSLVAAVGDWRRARPWVIITVVAFVLALGAQPRFNGHDVGPPLFWAKWVTYIFRFPFRLSGLVAFGLAMCSGLGLAVMLDRLSSNRRPIRVLLLVFAFSGVLIEYLYVPFPSTNAQAPVFFEELAEQPGDGAILDLPLGRQPAKLSMYWQTVHERPIVDGHVSRTPLDAYDWVDSQPVLRSLRTCDMSLPPADLAPLLPQLVGTGIEYVAVHKISAVVGESIPVWDTVQTQDPLFKNKMVVIYPIDGPRAPLTDAPQLVESCIAVRSAKGITAVVEPGETWEIVLEWTPGRTQRSEYQVELALVDADGGVMINRLVDMGAAEPMSEWEQWEHYEASYELPLDSSLAPGRYWLQVTIIPPNWGGGELLAAQLIEVQVVEP